MAKYGTFDYVTTLEDSDGIEREVLVVLACTALGTDAQLYGPPENCYPAEAPEFDFDYLGISTDDGAPMHSISNWQDIVAVLPDFEKAYERAVDAAIESGEFSR